MFDRLSNRTLLALVLALAMSNWLFATSSVIGVATAQGGFRVNDTAVTGNATLFEGSVLETGKASSSVRLDQGARMQLAGSSRGRLYHDHAILERGTGEFQGSYRVEALGLNIEPGTAESSARIVTDGSRTVEVAVLTGNFRVMSADGYAVGNIAAGNSLAFEPQAAGAATPSKMTGCLANVDGKFYLDEETSGTKLQMVGKKLEAEAGNRVEVVGTAIGNQQIQVNTMKRLQKGCGKPVAGVPGGVGKTAGSAGKAAGAAAKTAGIATSTKAVIAGVAIAAAAGTGAGVYSATNDSNASR